MKDLSQRELDETLAASEGIADPPRPPEPIAADDTIVSAQARVQPERSLPGEEDTLMATRPDPYADLDDTVAEPAQQVAAAASSGASTLSAGQVIGRMVILSQLGAGGMGVVYSAYDPELDRKVALKVIRSEMGWSEEARTRLLREAQALARLQHPNVVAVHDCGRYKIALARYILEDTAKTAYRLRACFGSVDGSILSA